MRFGHFSRQVVFGNDDTRGPAVGSRQRLEWILPCFARAQIDGRQPLSGSAALALWGTLAIRTALTITSAADQRLRMRRGATRRVESHPLEHLHELVRVVSGSHDSFEGVAIGAI